MIGQLFKAEVTQIQKPKTLCAEMNQTNDISRCNTRNEGRNIWEFIGTSVYFYVI